MAQLTEMVPPAAAGALLRAVFALPRPVKRLIAGAPVRRDGQELALDAQLLLLMSKLDHRSLAGGTPEEARAGIARAKEMLGRVPDRPVRTREVAIADAVTGRLYTPKGLAEGSPLLVYYHGGGWVIGDIDSHDTVCRYLAAHADVRVLSVGYRLAPEHPYPAAAEDALTAYEYAVKNAADLGAGEAVAVGGDSAGGNLAAVVGIMADPAPDFALLIYPAVDLSTRRSAAACRWRRRCWPGTCPGSRRPTWSPPGSTRCGTRARSSRSGWRRPACRWRCGASRTSSTRSRTCGRSAGGSRRRCRRRPGPCAPGCTRGPAGAPRAACR